MTVHITIEDHDDRPERMVRDPDRYFADARLRAEQELMHQARWLFRRSDTQSSVKARAPGDRSRQWPRWSGRRHPLGLITV